MATRIHIKHDGKSREKGNDMGMTGNILPKRGFRISKLEKDGPAEQAGLAVGEVLTTFGLTPDTVIPLTTAKPSFRVFLADANSTHKSFFADKVPKGKVGRPRVPEEDKAAKNRQRKSAPEELRKSAQRMKEPVNTSKDRERKKKPDYLIAQADRMRRAWNEADPEKRAHRTLQMQSYRNQLSTKQHEAEKERRYKAWAEMTFEEKQLYRERDAELKRQGREAARQKDLSECGWAAKAERELGLRDYTLTATPSIASAFQMPHGRRNQYFPRKASSVHQALLSGVKLLILLSNIQSEKGEVLKAYSPEGKTVECGKGWPVLTAEQRDRGQVRQPLSHDPNSARQILSGEAFPPEYHDDMLLPPETVENPVVALIMDWMSELVGEEQGVRIFPTLPFSMGEIGPIPIVPAPPRRGDPAVSLAVIRIGVATVGHVVTVAVSSADDPVLKRVHVFDSLWGFTMDEENPRGHEYIRHIGRVGAALLGLDHTEGVRLCFHPVPQQSPSGNSCSVFAMLFAAALAYGIDPNSLSVPTCEEVNLRRRFHDFLFCFPEGGYPSLNPIVKALQATTDWDMDHIETEMVPCQRCPEGRGNPLDVTPGSVDVSMASVSLSDDAEEAEPGPLATSSPPQSPRATPSSTRRPPLNPRKKHQKRTEPVRRSLGSSFLIPLQRPGVSPSEASQCPNCGSFLFAAEAGAKGTVKTKWCCAQGDLLIPQLKPFEADFYKEGSWIKPSFRDCSRKLNGMASMATSGVAGRWVTWQSGTNFVKVQGRTYHSLPSLKDPRGPRPNQMCILDPDYRGTHSRSLKVEPQLTADVFEFLEKNNGLYKEYKALGSMGNVRASLLFEKTTRKTHGPVLGDRPGREGQQNLMPMADEIAAVMTMDEEGGPREVRVWAKGEATTKSISYLHPAYEALSYPLLRPFAEASWDPSMVGRSGRKITQQIYHRQIQLRQPRMWELDRLGQEALVDSFIRVESERLEWVRRNQATLRMGSRDEIARHFGEEADETLKKLKAGREIVVLPATFTNSPRQMRQLYHDAMRIVAAKGKPTFFITFTCNPKWPEIVGAASEEEAKSPEWASRRRKAGDTGSASANFSRRPTNTPSVIARVFKLKLGQLMQDIRTGKVFGSKTVYDLVCIEFQKRGLPHAHILVRLVKDISVDEIDQHISAEMPGPDQPELRERVLKHMIHGPCGSNLNPHSPCMDETKRHCTKFFPKDLETATRVDGKGFPHYRRRGRHTATIRRLGRDFVVGDSFVVPHVPLLLLKYDAHINVEYATTPRTTKYLFKYCLKGPDKAKVALEKDGDERRDEVAEYETQRMVGACEAAWRLFEFDLHSRSLAVISLPVHLEDKDQLTFNPKDPKAALAKTSRLLRYLNRPKGNEFDGLTYCSFYERYFVEARPSADSVPHPDKVHHVRPRKRGEVLARLNWVSMGLTELFFLRLILSEFPARSYNDLRTVRGVLHPTFHAAAKAHGLADDDKEYFTAVREAHGFLTAPALRSFFVSLLLGETRTPAPALWDECADLFSEDHLQNDLPTKTAHTRALIHIGRLLSLHGRSLTDFGLPDTPDPDSELARELSRYPAEESREFVEHWRPLFTMEQRRVIDSILSRFPEQMAVIWPTPTETSKDNEDLKASPSKYALLLAAGGCGKTEILKFLAHHLRLLGEVVICSASTGIAATNYPGGITAHSAFKLPFDSSDPTATSGLSMSSQRAALLRRASLIIYDEVGAAQRNSFRSFQRLLQDLQSPCLRVVLLCGDYAQIPPVVKHGAKKDILQASTLFLPEWQSFPVLQLTKNMRASTDPEYAEVTRQVGQGQMEAVKLQGFARPLIPLKLIQTVPSREDLVRFVYPSLEPEDCISRAILSGTNEAIDGWNMEMLSRLPGPLEDFFSADSAVESETTSQLKIPPETLATFNETGTPPHKLSLKVGAIVMILRNLNFDAALCNGVKGIVKGFSPSRKIVYVLVPKAGGAPGEGRLHAIPRITFRFSPSGRGMDVTRRQFPLRLAYALTFNKSQGQTLSRVGVDLMEDVFAHGQLYVVLSRVRHRDSIRVLTRPERVQKGILYTHNLVYPELVGQDPEPEPDDGPASRPSSPTLPDGPEFFSDHSDEL